MSQAANTNEAPPQAILFDAILNFFRSRTIQAFAQLRVADDIAAGRVPAVDKRFLKAAASLQLIRETGSGAYELLPLGEALRTDVPGSMQAMVSCVMGGAHYGSWGKLPEAVKTGKSPMVSVYGEDVWKYFTETNPDEGHLFNQAMSNFSAAIVQSLLHAYELPNEGLWIDVAGGNGTLLCAILKAKPGLSGIVTDLSFTQEAARAYIAAQGLTARCQTVAGDFFVSVPEGGDYYSMKHILHDWADDKAAQILQTVRRAMKPSAGLRLIEAVVPEVGDDSAARMMDLNMMVMCDGKERTAGEWDELLGANGFRLDRIIALPGAMVSVIEASPK